MNVSVDGDALSRRLRELALISYVSPPAVTRVLFSETDRRGREFVRQSAREAGLTIREDAIGNIFMRWKGRDPSLPAVATGSHTDAIPNDAGAYFQLRAARRRANGRTRSASFAGMAEW